MNEIQITDTPYAMVVDDDDAIRTEVMHLLERTGFLVVGAASGDAAFDLLQKVYSDIALLFTDVQMPGVLDGFALARRVSVSWPDIAIVVASGNMTPTPDCLPEKARFIAKPFSAELVRAHLQEILPDGQKPERLKRAKRTSPGLLQ